MNTVSFVIGSWGSYNECNERALGSKWLDFDDYDDWDRDIIFYRGQNMYDVAYNLVNE